MSRIFETERFKTGYSAYEIDREMAQAMYRNNLRDWVLPNCVSRELFDKVHAENERLRNGIDDALLHLATNYGIDGNSMNDSDAADSLRRALAPKTQTL